MVKPAPADVRDYTFDELKPGMSVFFDVCLDRSRVEAFAGLSGDISPLHVDEAFGRASRFGGNVVHGMLMGSFFSTAVGVFLPGRRAVLSSCSLDFVKPVLVGETVTVSAGINQVHPDSRSIRLRLLVLRGQEVCVEGSALVKVEP